MRVILPEFLLDIRRQKRKLYAYNDSATNVQVMRWCFVYIPYNAQL